MASTNWVKYSTTENLTVIFNLERASRFRHFDSGSESYIEVAAEGETHMIMLSTDPGAYQDTLEYIQRTTGYQLT